jgi:hypothetical protein
LYSEAVVLAEKAVLTASANPTVYPEAIVEVLRRRGFDRGGGRPGADRGARPAPDGPVGGEGIARCRAASGAH